MKNRRFLLAVISVLLLSLTLSMLPETVSAASSSELRKQIKELKEKKAELDAEIKVVSGQYKENENEIANLVSRKNAIDQEITILHDQVDNINEQLAVYALMIADKQDELDDANSRLNDLNEKNKERIRAMEEEGKLSYWSIIFKANSFSDLLDRISMIEEINASDRRRLSEIREAAARVASAQEELAVEKAELEDAHAQLAEAELALGEKRAEADSLLTELIAKGQEFELLLEEGEDAQSELMKEIAQAEKDLKKAEYEEWLATYVPPTTRPPKGDTTPSPEAPSSSGWVSPLSRYTLTSPFGMRKHPILGYERMHEGVDMAAGAGTPIYAAKSGKVTIAKYSSSAGNYVSINHGDGFSSVYMHMTRYIVSKGQYVTAGQVIGYVGNTGLSKGNHLHFGIAYNGTYVNPMKYI